jgi:hypothetical protein
MSDKKFIDGLFTSRRENAPEFVIANLSFKTEKFIKWLQENTNERGYCNVDIKRNREGVLYSDVNEWKAQEGFVKNDDGSVGTKERDEEDEDIRVENIPF